MMLGACTDSPLAPSAAVPRAPLGNSSSTATPAAGTNDGRLLACPVAVGDSATAVIGTRGGVVRAAGSELRVGPGAVSKPTAFTLVVPASSVMEVEIHAEGTPSYRFRHRVSVTIDYSRCAASALPQGSLAAWYIDPSSKRGLQNMRAEDDRAAQRLTFYTDHLSGYALAY
jgi:hypothetical protein